MAVVKTGSVRRRRRPEEAEREILDAAEELLRGRPFQRPDGRRADVADRPLASLLLRLLPRPPPPDHAPHRPDRRRAVRDVRALAAGQRRPVEDARAAVEGVAAVYAEHGPVLRAIAEAASHDPDVEAIYHGLIERFVRRPRRASRRRSRAGGSSRSNPRETARALVWMNERYLLETLGRLPQEPVDRVVETLWTIWVRALYLQTAMTRPTEPAGRLVPAPRGQLGPHARRRSDAVRRQRARLRGVHREHRAAAASRASLPAEARVRPARPGPAEVGRRPAPEPSLPRAPHRAAGAGQRRPASNARGPRVLAAARPRQAALGDLARRRPRG